jgi:hypothetical protein
VQHTRSVKGAACRGIALKEDYDLFAVYLVGTLVLLGQIILYKYQEEESLSREREANPDREAKLQFMVATYLEAELLIGQGVGNRRGYLTTAQKCRDVGCYRRWFKTGHSNIYISVESDLLIADHLIGAQEDSPQQRRS